jgi:CRISP-associated protein Cas1
MPQDLHDLPKLRDSLSYLYLEHGNLEQTRTGVEFFDSAGGRTMVPTAALALLMLGPGTTVTHAAVKSVADHGCLMMWTGEEGVRFYAQGCGETRKAYHLLRQAEMVCDPRQRSEVVLRMYRYRFGEGLDPGLSLPEVRGYEGVRVRTAYAEASARYGVAWHGRSYDRANWNAGDPVNRALSAANACLNGLCHAGIVSAGYCPALGFIHTGKQLSFVYDIADLYKVEMTIPVAFRIVAESSEHVESRARQTCREVFRQQRLLARIIPDIDLVLGISDNGPEEGGDSDSDQALPEPLWAPLLGEEAETGSSHGAWEDDGDGGHGARGGAAGAARPA